MRERSVQKILGVEDAAEIVEVLASDGEDGLCVRADHAQVVAQAVLEVEPEHLRARRHERVSRLVAEVEHAVDHGLFRFLEGAVLRSLFDEVLDLVLRHRVLEFRIESEHEQDEIGRAREERDERAREAREAMERAVVVQQDLLRFLHGGLFRQELAEEQHDVRHEHDGEREREHRRVRQKRREQRTHERREQGPARRAEQHAHERDADLRDGERVLRLLEDRERRGGVLAALVGEPLEAAPVALHERCLDEGEKAVEQEQDDNQHQQQAGLGTTQNMTHPLQKTENDRKRLRHRASARSI